MKVNLWTWRRNLYIILYFSGVSCDSCLKGNFRGRRYKCLICYDYDLCSTCYEAGATNTRHTTDHPMQCILTRADFGKCPVTIQNFIDFLKRFQVSKFHFGHFFVLYNSCVCLNLPYFLSYEHCRALLWWRSIGECGYATILYLPVLLPNGIYWCYFARTRFCRACWK